MKILEIGIGTCVEKFGPEHCSEGCWVQAERGKGFSLLDADSSSFIGPALGVIEGCGCKSKNHPAKPANSFKNKKSCPSHECLNGGRCVPTTNGFR